MTEVHNVLVFITLLTVLAVAAYHLGQIVKEQRLLGEDLREASKCWRTVDGRIEQLEEITRRSVSDIRELKKRMTS